MIRKSVKSLAYSTSLSPVSSAVSASVSADKVFDFSTLTTPSELTYARSDAVATYRDSNGDLQQSSANAARYDHDADGNFLGVRIEDTRENKNTNYNFSPTDATGITFSGGTGTVTVVDKSAALATLGLDQIGNGKMYECEAIGATLTVYIDGTVGNTNTHSFRLYGWSEVGAVAVDLTGAGSVTMPFGEENFAEIKSENITPTHSSRKIRINIAAGRKVYFIGNQLEEAAFLSSPIVVAGAAATRQRDQLYDASLDTRDYFDIAQGAITANYRIDAGAADLSMYPFMISNGTGFTDTYAAQLTSGRTKVSARVRANNTEYVGTDVGGYHTEHEQFVGVSWNNGVNATVIASGGAFITDTMGASATGIDRLQIGGRTFTDVMFGHVKSLSFYKGSKPTNAVLGKSFFVANDNIFIGGGQSNMWGYDSAQTGADSGGMRAMVDAADVFFPTKRNIIANGSTPATSAVYYSGTSTADNWWYNVSTGEFGTPMDDWETVVGTVSNGTEKFIMWDQGESDASGNATDYKAALEAIFNRMRSIVGALPVIIIPIGRKETLASAGYQMVREVQQDLESEYAWIHLAPEKFIQPMTDELHLTEAGYIANAPLAIRKGMNVIGETVSGGVDGPVMASAVRVGTTVTVTITHDGGTDFTPTTAIEGFRFFDDASEIVVSSVMRSTATTITMTLASLPTGVETLYYGYQSLENVDETKLVVDNDTISLPLRSGKIVL